MSKLTRIAALSAFLILPAAAQAQVSPYLFGGMGEAQNGTREKAVRVGVGFEFGILPIFTPSVEGSYFHSAGAKGMSLNGKVDLPLPAPGLTPFVKGGLGRVEESVMNRTDAKMVGAGVEVEMLDWGIRLEGELYTPDDQHNIEVWTLGAFLAF